MSRSIVRLRTAKRAGLATALACALVAVPAASQQAKGPKTQLWLDVATHSMAGMPDMSSGIPTTMRSASSSTARAATAAIADGTSRASSVSSPVAITP